MTSQSTIKGVAVARGVVWRVIEVMGSEALAFGSFILLARLLVPEDFGVVSQATLVILSAQLVLETGLPEALVQKEGVESKHFDTCFLANLVLGALTMMLLIAVAPLAAIALSEPGLGWVLAWLAPTLVVYSASRIILAKLRRELRFQGFFVLNVSATFAGAATAIAMAMSGFGIWSLVAQQWMFTLAGLIMGWAYCRWLPKMRFEWQHVREMWAFSSFTVLEALLSYCTRRLDLFIIAIFWTATEVGYYFLANRLLFSAGMLTYYSICHLGLPFLARLTADELAHREAIYRTLRLVSLSCLPTLVGLGTIAPLFVPLLFGDAWLESIAPFQMLCALSIFYALALMSGQVLISAGHAKDAMVLGGINAVLFLAAVTAAGPFGITAAATAGGLANMVAVPIYLRQLQRRFAIDLWRVFHEQVPSWTATAVMAVVVLGLQHWLDGILAPWAILVIGIVAGASVFAAIMVALARAELAEIYSSFANLGGSEVEQAPSNP